MAREARHGETSVQREVEAANGLRMQGWLSLFDSFDKLNTYLTLHARSISAPVYYDRKTNEETHTALFFHINLAFKAWLFHDQLEARFLAI